MLQHHFVHHKTDMDWTWASNMQLGNKRRYYTVIITLACSVWGSHLQLWSYWPSWPLPTWWDRGIHSVREKHLCSDFPIPNDRMTWLWPGEGNRSLTWIMNHGTSWYVPYPQISSGWRIRLESRKIYYGYGQPQNQRPSAKEASILHLKHQVPTKHLCRTLLHLSHSYNSFLLHSDFLSLSVLLQELWKDEKCYTKLIM